MVATGASGVVAAIVTVIVWCLSLWPGITVPDNVALAMGTILTSLIGLMLHRNLSQPPKAANSNAPPAPIPAPAPDAAKAA